MCRGVTWLYIICTEVIQGYMICNLCEPQRDQSNPISCGVWQLDFPTAFLFHHTNPFSPILFLASRGSAQWPPSWSCPNYTHHLNPSTETIATPPTTPSPTPTIQPYPQLNSQNKPESFPTFTLSTNHLGNSPMWGAERRPGIKLAEITFQISLWSFQINIISLLSSFW